MFEVVVSNEGTARSIGLIGELDLEALPEVADVLSASLSDGSSTVQIDLQGADVPGLFGHPRALHGAQGE